MSKRPSDSKPPREIKTYKKMLPKAEVIKPREDFVKRTKQHSDSLMAANKPAKKKSAKKQAAKRVPTPIMPPTKHEP